jgi:hypothetical protein
LWPLAGRSQTELFGHFVVNVLKRKHAIAFEFEKTETNELQSTFGKRFDRRNCRVDSQLFTDGGIREQCVEPERSLLGNLIAIRACQMHDSIQ